LILLIFFVLGLLAVPLLGGRLSRLALLRLRMPWTIAVTVVVQVLVLEVVQDTVDHTVLAIVHVASYGLAAAFVIANRKLFGMWLMALGGCLNLLAITVNGGVMPADPGALARAGRGIEAEFDNSTYVADAKLRFLGDIFAVPKGLPLANVFSIGDVILTIGMVAMLHWICRSRLIPRRIRERRPPTTAPAPDRAGPVTE
jgi:hypothetical protein